MYDYAIIGGGIVGLSVAMALTRQHPGCSIRVLEKESALAQHQTGHNSGVIHAGVYYQPGSLKARFCKSGIDATIAFCTEHQIPFEQCGKLLVATDALERDRMQALAARCAENGIDARLLSTAELADVEPHVRGVGALHVSKTGIVDYIAMVRRMAELVEQSGGQVSCDSAVLGIQERRDGVTLTTGAGEVQAKQLIACAGLQADRVARLAGLEVDFQIVPFRGEYYRLAPRCNDLVSHLIYPIPDPALPFLGVHLTRMIGGYVTVGPNAVLGFSREGYAKMALDWRDLSEMARFDGFWKVVQANWRSGLTEFRNSLSKRGYLALCQRYCPQLSLDDLSAHPAGIRAQAVMRDGTLVHDFLVRRSARTLHVCNAPSPAATSSIPIGRHLAGMLTGQATDPRSG